MGHLNLLIHQRPSNIAHVVVRERYTPLDDRNARISVRATERFDASAIGRTGHQGATVYEHNAEGIERAVARLRARYGADLRVQNNIPDARFDRPLAISGIVADSGRSGT